MSDNLPAPAVEAEIAELESLMVTDRRAYNAHEGRYRELLEAREAGVPAGRSRGAMQRIEIEALMRSDPKRYYRDEALQQRYRDLLAAENAEAAAPEGRELSPGDLVPLLAPSDWSEEVDPGADYGTYRQIVTTVNDLLNGAGAAAGSLGDSFSALPKSVWTAAFAELADRSTVVAEPVPEDELKAILQEGGNATLAREWGEDAPRKFGIVRERLWRVIDRLDDRDAQAFSAWHANLPAQASAALARRLAG